MTETWQQLLVWVPLAAFILTLITFTIARFNDARAKGEKDGNIAKSLESIDQSLVEIKGQQRESEKEAKEYGQRLSRVEESSKSAHKRLDILEGTLTAIKIKK